MSLKVIFVSAMYLLLFVLYLFILFLLFNFNQYIGIFFIVEITTVLFIIVIVMEFRYAVYDNRKSFNFYRALLLFVFFGSTSLFFYFNKLNYVYFNYYLLNNNQSNSMISVYKVLNTFTYYFFIGFTFIVLSHVIISLMYEYCDNHCDPDGEFSKWLIWYNDVRDIHILPIFGIKEEFDPIDFIQNPNSLSKPIFRKHL